MSVTAPAAVLFGCILLLVFLMHRKINSGGGCCGEHEAAAKKIRPKDSKLSNYPYKYTAEIGGMVCSHCVRNVENAFNSEGYIFAKVHLETKTAEIYSKQKLTRKDAAAILNKTSYTITDLKEEIR